MQKMYRHFLVGVDRENLLTFDGELGPDLAETYPQKEEIFLDLADVEKLRSHRWPYGADAPPILVLCRTEKSPGLYAYKLLTDKDADELLPGGPYEKCPDESYVFLAP